MLPVCRTVYTASELKTIRYHQENSRICELLDLEAVPQKYAGRYDWAVVGVHWRASSRSTLGNEYRLASIQREEYNFRLAGISQSDE